MLVLFAVIDNLWDPWTEWSTCSATCTGVQTRTRNCKDSSAYYCTSNGGAKTESRSCNQVNCGTCFYGPGASSRGLAWGTLLYRPPGEPQLVAICRASPQDLIQ